MMTIGSEDGMTFRSQDCRTSEQLPAGQEPDCGACPLIESRGRRDFLRDAAGYIAAGLAALASLGASAADARALPVRWISALAAHGDERTYPLPASDGVNIDRRESVIVARWQGTVYAYSLACPHQNTALRWNAGDAQFQCPKHHSKYRPDGTFIEGRATRGMDRFAIRVEGESILVDIDKLYRQDKDAAEWKAAEAKLL
jgi:nitrite reductase/ring-hydroxylating ferredoxin subunit